MLCSENAIQNVYNYYEAIKLLKLSPPDCDCNKQENNTSIYHRQ